MKFLCFLLFLSLFVLPVSATDNTGYDLPQADELITTAEQDIIPILESKYQDLIQHVRKLDPAFVAFLESVAVAKENRINVLRSYLAKKTFEYYKNKFLSDLKQRSSETGRKIDVKDYSPGMTLYSLDGGRLDEPECHVNGDVRRLLICEYPDGYEDFYVEVKNYGPSIESEDEEFENFRNTITGNLGSQTMQISMDRDFPAENRTLAVDITLYNDSVSGNSENENSYTQYVNNDFYFEIIVQTERYDESHLFRNSMVARVRDGLPLEGMMLPGASVQGAVINAEYNSNRSVTKE